MALYIFSGLASLGSRVVEYSNGYDDLVKAYLKSGDDKDKQRIMDNITLYPGTHKSLLVVKFMGDTVLLSTAAKAAWPFIKSCASDAYQSIINCWNAFVDFLKNAYNSVVDLYNSSSNLTDAFVKIRDRICEGLVKGFQNLQKIIVDTLMKIKNGAKDLWQWIKDFGVDAKKGPNGQVTVTMSGCAPIVLDPFGWGKCAWQCVKDLCSFIFGTIGTLLCWIGSQISVEVYKYLCSLYGLILYNVNRMPQHAMRQRIRVPQ